MTNNKILRIIYNNTKLVVEINLILKCVCFCLKTADTFPFATFFHLIQSSYVRQDFPKLTASGDHFIRWRGLAAARRLKQKRYKSKANRGATVFCPTLLSIRVLSTFCWVFLLQRLQLHVYAKKLQT